MSDLPTLANTTSMLILDFSKTLEEHDVAFQHLETLENLDFSQAEVYGFLPEASRHSYQLLEIRQPDSKIPYTFTTSYEYHITFLQILFKSCSLLSSSYQLTDIFCLALSFQMQYVVHQYISTSTLINSNTLGYSDVFQIHHIMPGELS